MARPRTDIGPRVVAAARARFLERGVDGASLRQIAADAKTSIGMVYYYYPTKDDLFLAVVEEVYIELLRDLEEALKPDVGIEERLDRVFLRVGRLSERELEVVRLIASEVLFSTERLALIADRFKRGHIPMLLATLLQGIQAGVLTSRVHPGALVLTLVGSAGFAQIFRRIADPAVPKALGVPEGPALSRALLDLVLNGIRAREGEPDYSAATTSTTPNIPEP